MPTKVKTHNSIDDIGPRTADLYTIPLITDHPLIKLTINAAALIMLWLSAQRFALCHFHPSRPQPPQTATRLTARSRNTILIERCWAALISWRIRAAFEASTENPKKIHLKNGLQNCSRVAPIKAKSNPLIENRFYRISRYRFEK